MRKGNFLERIQKIYDLLGRGHAMNTQELYELMKEPKGTVSPFLSFMVRTGNLLKNKDGYLLTPFPQDPKKVAQEIRVLIANDRQQRIDRARNFRAQRGLFEELKPSSEPKKLIEEWMHEAPAKPEKIKAAIELLKNNGYKILKPTTEFKEI